MSRSKPNAEPDRPSAEVIMLPTAAFLKAVDDAAAYIGSGRCQVSYLSRVRAKVRRNLEAVGYSAKATVPVEQAVERAVVAKVEANRATMSSEHALHMALLDDILARRAARHGDGDDAA